jgi:tripartite-type tricarboxylate transporter receptor subunit TctC
VAHSLAGLTAFAVCCASVSAGAASGPGDRYPSKPIRCIVNASPGGAPDIIARSLGQKMAASLGQQIIVDLRSSAGGLLAGELAANAQPDGYTVLLAGAAIFGVLPAVRTKLPFDPFRDFAPITLVAESPNVVAVYPGLPVKTVAELVHLAKSTPLNFASSGALTPAHLGGELLNALAGLKMTHISYKGAAPALNDLIAGQVQVFVTAPISAMPQVPSGRVRVIATTGAKRNPAWPDLPAVAETIPGYEITQWWGLVVPAKTPMAIRQRLHDATLEALRAPDVRERLLAQGANPVGNTPQELTAYIQAEFTRTVRIVKQAGIPRED